MNINQPIIVDTLLDIIPAVISASEVSNENQPPALLQHEEQQLLTEQESLLLEDSNHKDYPKFLNSLIQEFTVSQESETQIYENFLENFQNAYADSQSNHDSRISMIPVFHVPLNFKLTKEQEHVLAVDIGGSTIRVSTVEINKSGEYQLLSYKQWLFQESEKVVDLKFFHDLGLKISEVLTHAEAKNDLKCGVVWSFPVDAQNKIITMGKGFSISAEVKDKPINEMIKEAVFNVSGKSIDVNSIINDSIAINLSTMTSHASICEVSLILGTGLNSCVLVKNVLYNVELGFYGRLIKPTKYDALIDQRFTDQPLNNWRDQPTTPLFMPLEFLCGSRYLCELVRLILKKEMGLDIADGPYSLNGEFLVLFEEEDLNVISDKLKERFNLELKNHRELAIIKKIVEVVLIRCSKYLKNALLSLKDFIAKENDEKLSKRLVIGFVGSFLQHSTFLQSLIKQGTGLELEFIENSNLIGAVVGSLIETQRQKSYI
ncbi:hypothetical protein WICPIJ_008501 [Wickerhamomyces pijperi]|uniref:Phosphotransferase n=1 Tax=Wickerhamomyces pijperi TaxID=599730 RepID=A0A9P8PYX4_WICPI|nr:hypothetical protein WICPIJ_008501 [Wickerhamomyces pijperi]